MRRASSVVALCVALLASTTHAQQCKGTLYLTIDTGWMNHAELIANTLNQHNIKATFFLANERTFRGDWSLGESWAPFWRARAAEGHVFATHTWHHGYFRGDTRDGRTLYVHMDGKRETFDRDAMCRELDRVEEVFGKMTGKKMERLWRAPGGITTPGALELAKQCGYPRHVKWGAFSATSCRRRLSPARCCSRTRCATSATVKSSLCIWASVRARTAGRPRCSIRC